MDILRRLESSKEVNSNGCWNWTGAKDSGGYGHLSYEGRTITAPRVIASLQMGLDLDDSSKHVCHKCDNPACFNPEHLYIGNNSTNMQDKRRTGRSMNGKVRLSKTHCRNGHKLEYPRDIGSTGQWQCVICHRAKQSEYYHRRKNNG